MVPTLELLSYGMTELHATDTEERAPP